MLRPNENRTPYEMWFNKKATVKHFKVFGSKCYIRKIEKNLGKFEDRSNEGIFLRYSIKKAYKCYNKRIINIVDNADIKVDEERDSSITIKENFPMYERIFEEDEKEIQT